MKKIPELLKHDGILVHWSTYPEGSIERAKSLGIELLSTYKSVEATVKLWKSECGLVAKEKAWKPLGLKSQEDFVRAVTGKSNDEVEREIFQRAEATKDNQQGKRNDLGHLSNGKKLQGGGNGIEYTLRRLARDHVELFEQAKRGELSVNAAAIQAGIRKKPTPEDACLKAFRKCSDLTEMLRRLQEYYEVAMRHKESTDGRRLD